jgi:hypothetical protein
VFDRAEHPEVNVGKVPGGTRFAQGVVDNTSVVLMEVKEHDLFGEVTNNFDIAICYNEDGNKVSPVLIRKKGAKDIRKISWSKALVSLYGRKEKSS